LEVEAEPKIVDAMLSSLESLSGKPRRKPPVHNGAYREAVLAEKPLAFWRCEEFGGDAIADASGNHRAGKVEGLAAFHLPGPDHESFSGDTVNRALQLAGGTVSVSVPKARSLSFWFWNGMDSTVRDNTGDLVQQGDALRLRIGGNADQASRGKLILQHGGKVFGASTELALRGWHHVLIAHDRAGVRVFLDGNPNPEIETGPSENVSESWRFGGELPLEGRIDEVAWFQPALDGDDAKRLYTASGMESPPKPVARERFTRGPVDDYAKAVRDSNPVAYWRLLDSAKDSGANAHHGKLEKGANPAPAKGDTFTGGRMRAEISGIGDTYSVAFWFRNSLPNRSRPVTGYLFSRGMDGLKSADGDQLGIGGNYAAPGRLVFYHGNSSQKLLKGKTELEPESWHHVAMVRQGEQIRVFLNGNPKPEINGKLARSYPEGHPQFFFGGRNDNFSNLNGRLDEVALYDRALTPEEIAAHYRAVKRTPLAEAEPKEEPKGLAPDKALDSIHIPNGYEVQLVAAEPLVQDPVAIDWGADGKLWVAEMADYPGGIDGKSGGRIRYLEDSDGDGVYDKSNLFLEGLNYPSGVMSFRKGILITAAPDIFYAEDTNGDGKADLREVLFTGFKQGNQQLRVNGLRWGLDNWIHCANGSHHASYASGIKIESPVSKQTFELGSLDFRFDPENAVLETLSGPSQFGRTRDDWGNWFGLQNSYPLWHYVLEHRYLARNPDFATPDPRRILTGRNPLVFPAKAPQKRFHNFSQSGRYTSACAPMVYRDKLLFDGPNTSTFTCEPFHNLVQRMSLRRDGASFKAERSETKDDLDFFASEDRWCRPVMARTGPDGALWIVDMYRYMIEHPDWLPAAGKAEMKPHERLGETQGRIYRVIRKGSNPRPFPEFTKASASELVKHLASENGIIRDMAHRLLIERGDQSVFAELTAIAKTHEFDQARLHALCVLDGLGRIDVELLQSACRDSHPEIRRHALRLVESRWDEHPTLLTEAIRLVDDPSAAVRLQVACSLGESKGPEAGKALAKLMVRDASDVSIRSAVFSSAVPHFDHLARAALEKGVLIDELLQIGGNQSRDALVSRLATPGKDGFRPGQLRSLAGWLDQHPDVSPELATVIEQARNLLGKDDAPLSLRTAATTLLGRQPQEQTTDLKLLTQLLAPQTGSELKLAAIDALARVGGDELPDRLLQNWPGHLPRERSRILDTLLRREEWTAACLSAIENGTVARGDLDASRRQLLLTHKDPAIRKTAQRVLQAGKRQPQIQAFRTALKLEGDQTRGRVVFEKLCATCHLPPGGLPMNGPDLRSITDRSADGLFSSILDPNQSVDPTYAGYSATLGDGAVLFGRVLSESSSHITLRLLDGTDRQLRRAEIKSLSNSGLSLMPEGLEAGMTQQDLADLIRFVQTFKKDG
ncbi:MAG: HEAT repeat domain-containing protein, partial [Verrucomicrobiales bacterium]|nr:HEAT repeat domain-containing protein [Verrucomicrobiales bacterium]